MFRFGQNAVSTRPAHPPDVADPNWAQPGTQLTSQQLNEIADILRSLNAVFSAGYVPGDTGGTILANAILSRIVAEAQTAAANLVDSAPDLLNTIKELATALGDDPNFATTTANALAGKLALAGGTMTGDLVLAGAPTEDDHAARKKYVDDEIAAVTSGTLDTFIIVDEKAANTNGGTFTSGAWRTRDLNTSVHNSISGASVSSNQLVLPIGDFEIEWQAPGYMCTSHQSRLLNVTDTIAYPGSSEYVYSAGVVTISHGKANVTLAASKTFEIQHRCTLTQSTYGFGVAANVGEPERYTWVKVTKL